MVFGFGSVAFAALVVAEIAVAAADFEKLWPVYLALVAVSQPFCFCSCSSSFHHSFQIG